MPAPAEGEPLPNPRTNPTGVIRLYHNRYIEDLDPHTDPGHALNIAMGLGVVTRLLLDMQLPESGDDFVIDTFVDASTSYDGLVARVIGHDLTSEAITEAQIAADSFGRAFIEELMANRTEEQ